MHPPSAPVEDLAPAADSPPISTDRSEPASPIRTGLKPCAELLAAPDPTEIISARLSAGQTQMEAANTIGANRYQTWSDYESGRKPMGALAWTWYLLATGLHPSARIIRRG